MESFGLSLNNTLSRDLTNTKTQIVYCFTNMKDLKSDYFESLTSFRKPTWIRTHKVLTKFHFDETEDIRTNIPFNIEDVVTDDQSETIEVDEKFVFEHYETVDNNKQTVLDMSFQLEDLKVKDPSDMMYIEEKPSSKTMKSLIQTQERFRIAFFLRLILILLQGLIKGGGPLSSENGSLLEHDFPFQILSLQMSEVHF